MSKAVLISIQPRWCELIASGEKTVEVRKTRPKIDTPFKCFIYCTKPKHIYEDIISALGTENGYLYAGGKVIGEFVCDAVFPISVTYSDENSRVALREFPYTGLTDKEIMDYLGNGKQGYGWHISDLVIYDQPETLDELCKPCINDCLSCECYSISYDPYEPSYCDWERYMESTESIIKRPPQSWCYVEDT